MQTFNILPFAAFAIIAELSAIMHGLFKIYKGEVKGNLYDYLFADYPGRTSGVFIAVISGSFAASLTGALDAFTIDVALAYLDHWQIPMPILNAGISAATLGWTADSMINKGST